MNILKYSTVQSINLINIFCKWYNLRSCILYIWEITANNTGNGCFKAIKYITLPVLRFVLIMYPCDQ